MNNARKNRFETQENERENTLNILYLFTYISRTKISNFEHTTKIQKQLRIFPTHTQSSQFLRQISPEKKILNNTKNKIPTRQTSHEFKPTWESFEKYF